MLTDPDYRDLARRLEEERAHLQRARENYEIITRSRFHALRMLWFSFKHLIGRASPSDMYAVWSPGLSIHVPAKPGAAATNGALSAAEQTLIESWNRRVAERPRQAPLVTVVIPVFNHREVTARCLQSIAASWFESMPVQFVVVDDGSGDDTAALISRLHEVDYVRNGHNEGFIHSCNRGAMIAQGKYVCFLNNDTQVRDGWLDHLVNAAEADPSIGIVGSKLIYPNGRLQEAGGIVWRDATGWNVGRNQLPDDPRFNFFRDVDYVSGAALLVRRDLFFQVGGFSDEFRPAYYEDTDLCFKVRAQGHRVVYQPLSEVVHYESITAGNERSGIKRYQEINRPKFRQKWAAELDRHLENGASNVAAAMLSHQRGRNVLIIDTYVPLHDRESGARRMFSIVKLLRRAGYNVTFLPDNFMAMQPYTSQLQHMGVQVLYQTDGGPTLNEALQNVLAAVDIAWISRPELFKKYAPLVRRAKHVRVVYDTVDLHHVRKQREAELNGGDDTEWRALQQAEAEAARSADVTVVVSPEERDALHALGVSNLFVVPNIHEPVQLPQRRFEDTTGLLFVGNYNHPPNLDAAQWLCREVMPTVWESLPDVRLTLAGSNPSDALRELASDRVTVTGHIPDLTPYFRRNRLFVAPLRFGAGMKGKVGQALEHGLPVVTTSVGAEGMQLRNGEEAMIAPIDAQTFAGAVISLYNDGDCWLKISRQGKALVARFTPEAIAPALDDVLSVAAGRVQTPT